MQLMVFAHDKITYYFSKKVRTMAPKAHKKTLFSGFFSCISYIFTKNLKVEKKGIHIFYFLFCILFEYYYGSNY
jgi:hypothetical protein